MSLENFKYIIVNSFDASGNSDTDFNVTLNAGFPHRLDQIALDTFVMTATYYNVTSSNNTFVFQEDVGGAVTATLTVGNYTIADMITSLKSAMEAVSPNVRTYTITTNASTNKLTITGSAGTFSVLTTGGLNLMLGFSRSTASGQNLANTGTRIYNLARYGFLTLKCTICKADTYNTITGNKQDIIAYIPIAEASFGEIYTYRPNEYSWIDVSPDRISRIEFLLTDDQNNVIDINGGYVSMKLALRYGYE
ncbi:MAG: hypothetical protein IPM51_12235 [Sphingobacteriaceae bacterium]|nr:hypothetical protein [Sphingobacteriaceae bacterium]